MTKPVPHVLVIGIDGVRYDTVCDVETPALDRMAQRGFLQPVQVNAAGPTISGPSWATVVTGVLPPVHRIFDNELDGHDMASNPDFIHLARQEHPGVSTFIGADWPPLVTSESGGPLFAGGGFLPTRRRDAGAGPDDWHDADQQVTDRAVTFLSDLDGRAGSVSFVYLHGCDTAGHRLGVGEVYNEFVRASDQRLAQVIEAVERRPQQATENWTVVAVTDHGHRDVGGHGADSPAERTAWIAAYGPGIPTPWSGQPLEQADVAGQVFHTLGMTPRTDNFIGVPFGRRPSAG